MLPYQRAQLAMAQLKASVYEMLSHAPSEGMTNAELGRSLGIYRGHVGHEGHISRIILAFLEEEAVALQDKVTKRWRLRRPSEAHSEAEEGK